MSSKPAESDVVLTDRDALIEVTNISKTFEVERANPVPFVGGDAKYLNAVDEISFTLGRGEIVGLAGQSGCGKSTLGELLVGLQQPTDGTISFEGNDVTSFDSAEMKAYRRRSQIVFQDPYESLNPRFTVSQIVSEPLKIHGYNNIDDRTYAALIDAGLEPPEEFLAKFPGELSGGERQRVSIARALVLEPDFLVADEPVSMLDVSVSTRILKLFKELQISRDITILYISHNLSAINSLTDRVMIMYLGNIVEVGETEDVIHHPAHPYTEDLLSAIPGDAGRSTGSIKEEIPDATDLPTGCRYVNSCSYSSEQCHEKEPLLETVGEEHVAACYHPVDR